MFPTADTEDISQVTSLSEKPCSSSDAQNPPENSQVATQHNNRELTLNMLIKEMVFCIALALTTYGALHNGPTKVSKHPQAERFFSPESVVIDWYRGQLSNVITSINNADVSFVMYYAPWDAESQYVRGEFEKAATILSDRVQFTAINCWNPGSECRLQHNKIPSWPILMAYTVDSIGVLYKGPRDAYSMVNFLGLITKPLKRVSTTEDLIHLLSYCDAVAVGYTPLSDTSKYYNTWYHVALKTREFDTIGEICFASVTSEDLAIELGVEMLPNARLMLWNHTKEYISEESDISVWNETSLMHWVLENFSQPVARVIPLWKKAFSFERYVDGNPILMLFTPLNPLYEQLPTYSLMREVAMEYYNCKNNESNQWTTELIKLQQIQRLLYQQKDFVKFCHEYKFKKPLRKHNRFFKKEIESHNNKYPWNNSTQKNQKSSIFSGLLKRGLDVSKSMDSADDNGQLFNSLSWLHECNAKALPAEKSFYEHYDKCQTFEETFNIDEDVETDFDEIETTMLQSEDDPLSPENLVQDGVKHFCKLMKFAQEFGPPIYPSKVPMVDDKHNITHITGLSCASNFSMYMIAVDSVQNHHFAESLGIDISSKKDRTAVVILDSEQESQYVLSEDLNAKSIRDFIYNFTNKSLKRSLRTHVDEPSHTHYFGSDSTMGQTETSDSSVHIIDLTTRTFRKVVRTPGMVTIVAVCGGACSSLNMRALAEATRLLRTCGVHVQAARLDALRHDLPWHYTVDRYPTIFVFPADRSIEAESRSLPVTARVSAAALVALALRSLGTPLHLRVRLALCTSQPLSSQKKICLKDIKEHISSVIGRNLKYWRRTDDRDLKDALFTRLVYLHRVSLELSLFHITDLTNSNKQESLFNSLHALSKNWDIDMSSFRRNNTISPGQSS